MFDDMISRLWVSGKFSVLTEVLHLHTRGMGALNGAVFMHAEHNSSEW